MLGKAAIEQITLHGMKNLVHIEKHKVQSTRLNGITDYYTHFLEML